MTLTPELKSLRALYRKLEREAYRAYHQRDPVHKTDHFFNFCITAHSLRDYFFVERGIESQSEKEHFHTLWNRHPELEATRDIANSAKHFLLRKAPRTKRVTRTESRFVDIFVQASGDTVASAVRAPDMVVLLSDGGRFDLYQFTRRVLDTWRDFLKSEGIRLRRQPFGRLRGTNPGG